MQRNIPVIKQSSVLWLKDFQVVNKCPNGLYVNWLIMWLMVSSLELKLSLMSITWFLLWLWAWDEKTAVGYTKALVTMLGRSPAAQPGTRSLLRLPIPKVPRILKWYHQIFWHLLVFLHTLGRTLSLLFTGVLLFYLSFCSPSTLYKHRCGKPCMLFLYGTFAVF